MATTLDFLKAKVLAYKHSLEGRSSNEKQRHVAIHVAQEFNSCMEEIKKEAPEAAPHLPKPITWDGIAARDMQVADVTFLDMEMLINQTLAVLDVIRGSR
jgi:hypothetical protein